MRTQLPTTHVSTFHRRAGRPSSWRVPAEPDGGACIPAYRPDGANQQASSGYRSRRHNSARWDCHLPASNSGPSFLNTFPVLRLVTLPPPSQPEGSRSLRNFSRRSQGLPQALCWPSNLQGFWDITSSLVCKPAFTAIQIKQRLMSGRGQASAAVEEVDANPSALAASELLAHSSIC